MTIYLPDFDPPLTQEHIYANMYGMPDRETYDHMYEEMRAAAKPQLDQFDKIWYALKEQVQEPVMDAQNELHLYGAHTGHRIVTIDDQIGRSALGFYLSMHDGRDNRAVSVSRRKVYAQERRRRHYVSDTFSLSVSDLYEKPYNRQLHHQLGVLGVWADKFLEAEPYD